MQTGRMAVVLGVALLAGVANPLAAQKYPGPAKVTAQGNGTSVTVSWAPVPFKGASYRVLRALDVKQTGRDLTRPLAATSFDDNTVVAGTTYFYQVIAVFADGTTGAADPVMVTAPNPAPPITAVIPSGARPAIAAQPVTIAPGPTPRRNLLAKPTAVTGITVNGTLASAVVSWTPVTGAASYSVARTLPGYAMAGPPLTGLTAATWTDLGPQGIGFIKPGVYRYDVTAILNDGTTVSGQASWTRPNPTCAALPPNQPMQPILDPMAPVTMFATAGTYPNGPRFTWMKTSSSAVVAYRMERSQQSSNAWTLAGTSCGAPAAIVDLGATSPNMEYADPLGGLTPGTTYLYRLTAMAANGEAGWNSVAWTAPNPGLVRWLAPTVTAYNITLRWRYEPPASGAPTLPDAFQLTSGYGPVKTIQAPCNVLAGCVAKDTILPGRHGAQQYRVTAGWRSYRPVGSNTLVSLMGTLTADTVITIP